MGGDQKLSDAEFAQLLFELERSSINDEDFARRLAHLQEYGNLGHFPMPLPQPIQPKPSVHPIPIPQPVQPIQPIQQIPQIPQIKPQIPPQFPYQQLWGSDYNHQPIPRQPPIGFQPVGPPPINLPPIQQSSNIHYSWSDSSLIRSMAPDHKYCQICRVSLDNQWVHITNCPTEHTFCITCAERLCSDSGNSRWNVNQVITCPLCRNCKSLGNGGIERFICSKDNHAGRVSYEDGSCPYHKDILLYLCMDCVEPMCVKCQTGYHKNHSYETLDTALADKKKQLKQLKTTLRNHRNDIVKTTEKLAAHKESIITNAQNRRDQIAIQFANLRDELNRKERELIQQINNLETRKNEQLEVAIAEATSELDSYDNALRIADQGSSLPANNPMQFIQFVCDKKDEIMKVVDLEETKNTTYKNASHNSIPVFPSLPATQNIQNSITRLQLL